MVGIKIVDFVKWKTQPFIKMIIYILWGQKVYVWMLLRYCTSDDLQKNQSVLKYDKYILYICINVYAKSIFTLESIYGVSLRIYDQIGKNGIGKKQLSHFPFGSTGWWVGT